LALKEFRGESIGPCRGKSTEGIEIGGTRENEVRKRFRGGGKFDHHGFCLGT